MMFPGKKVACDNKMVNIYHLLVVRIFKRTQLRELVCQRMLTEKKSPHR